MIPDDALPKFDDCARQIIGLALEKCPREEIAQAVGADLREVYAVISLARKAGIDVPRLIGGWSGRLPGLQRVSLSAETARGLAPAARARGLQVSELAARLLAACAEEPVLIDNILEDLE